jgi:hypothetical protein
MAGMELPVVHLHAAAAVVEVVEVAAAAVSAAVAEVEVEEEAAHPDLDISSIRTSGHISSITSKRRTSSRLSISCSARSGARSMRTIWGRWTCAMQRRRARFM